MKKYRFEFEMTDCGIVLRDTDFIHLEIIGGSPSLVLGGNRVSAKPGFTIRPKVGDRIWTEWECVVVTEAAEC